jgi:DNA-binding beta-propeller fold protein YncE
MLNARKPPCRSWTLGSLLALIVLAVTAAPALASRGHEYTETFGKHCSSEPCKGEALKQPNGVAVNEATGDVYVVDEGADRVVRFDKAGVQGEFNGSGSLSGEGKAAGSGPGEVPTGEFDKPETIAVDNSCVLRKLSEPECATEDPSNGDVYVVDAGHLVIDKYTADGEYVGQITGAEARFTRTLDGVAVDSRGGVWVFQENGIINGFNNATPNAFARAIATGIEGFGLPGIAVDGEGDFYLRESVGADRVGRIAKVSSTGKVITEDVDGKDATAVAADQSSNDVLIDNITTVGVFGSALVELERLGEGHLSAGAGIGVNASAETVYVADAGAGDIVVFGPVLPSAPTIESESESVSQVTSEAATLGAEINPRGEAREPATEYRFEYGACTSLVACPTSGYEGSAPAPEGQLSPDFNGQAVSVQVTDLRPDTTYHFRALAHNSHGEGAPGEERTFTTEALGSELVLPDDRGWELVSPPDKLGALIEPIEEAGVVQAAASGDAITYLANSPTEAQPEGNADEAQILSRRGVDGWSTRDIAIPHTAAAGFPFGAGPEYKFFNPELTLGAVQPFGQFDPLLSGEASESTSFLHDLDPACGSSCYRPFVTGKPGLANVPAGTVFGEEERCKPKGSGAAVIAYCGPEFVGASVDLAHVVLRAQAELVPGAGAGQLYEWNEGALARVSVLPGEAPAAEGAARLGLKDQATRGAISSDGSRVVWEAAPNLYLRDMAAGGHGETVQMDKAEAKCEAEHDCTSGGGRFQFASAEGSRVLFTDTRRLTSDSGAEPEGSNPEADLYECQIVLDPELSCELTDLTPKHGSEGANVQGGVLGASEDGSYLYFVADGVQSEANSEGKGPIGGQPNLYLRHDGTTSFIATLSAGDYHDWREELSGQPTRVSTNGRYLELMSQSSLTGYDNIVAGTDQPAAEVYLYDAVTGRLVCASCDPTGEQPLGVEYKKLEPGSGGLVGGPLEIWPGTALVAANVPGWTAIATGGSQQKNRYQSRYLSSSGRLFFNTEDALVPQDTNGTEDVYEYEPLGIEGPAGEADCTSSMSTYSERSDGCVGLISSGSSNQESAFLDASESGNDVFFLTSARLSPLDTDTARDVYDAHVCSDSPCIAGAAAQSQPCTTEASCKPASTPPSIFGAPATATLGASGNLAPPPAVVKAKAKPLTRAQKLSAALKTCKRRPREQRAGCEKRARKRYGPLPKKRGKRR